MKFLHITLPVVVLALTAFEGRAQRDQIKKIEFDDANLADIIEYFQTDKAGKRRNIIVDPKLDRDKISVTLTLRDVTKGVAFAYAAEIGGFDYREERHALRIFPRKGKPVAKAFLKRGAPMTTRRASEIRVPKVEFDATELSQVINDLANASQQFDPRKKGLNIILGYGVDPTTPVTFRLQNVPLSTALKYVAEFARLNVRTDGAAIVLTNRARVAKPKPIQ